MATSSKSFNLSGRMLGPYRVLGRIGRGGMGEVYEAHEDALDRKVALKVLFPALATDEDYVMRFAREAKAAAKLDHPNIVSIYSVGEQNGIHYIAMQYVKGATLASLLKDEGTISVSDALSIARSVAEALQHAHSHDVVHRDVKPENIMIDLDGRVRVMDFGLARPIGSGKMRITQAGMYLGTPEYSSPEQCESRDLDGRSDLYSLGVVLYEMLSGRVPHSADTPLALMRKITSEEPRPLRELNPNVPPGVAALVDKLLAKDMEDRFPSGSELGAEISRILAGEKEFVGAETVAIASDALRERVTEIAAARVTEPVPTEVASAPTVRSGGSGKRILFSVISVAVVLVLIMTAYLLTRSGYTPAGNGDGTTAAAGTTERSPAKRSHASLKEAWKKKGIFKVVILDFMNKTASEELAWMQCGIADMLITDLRQCGYLSVVAREELRRLLVKRKINEQAVASRRDEILGAMEADLLLEGDFFKTGTDVCIKAKLVDCYSGKSLVDEKVTGTEESILAMIDSLSLKIRTRLDKHLSPSASARPLFAMRHSPLRDRFFPRTVKKTRHRRAGKNSMKRKKSGDAPSGRAFEPEAAPDLESGQDAVRTTEEAEEKTAKKPERLKRSTKRDRSVRRWKVKRGVAYKGKAAEEDDEGVGSVVTEDGAPALAGKAAPAKKKPSSRSVKALRLYYHALRIYQDREHTRKNLIAASSLLKRCLKTAPNFRVAGILAAKISAELKKTDKK
jgi:TolB-like protein